MTGVRYPAYTGDEPCRATDPEVFFLELFSPYYVKTLRSICEDCPIKGPCAEYAIEHEIEGFWGGLTPAERDRIRRRRNIRLRQIHIESRIGEPC